MELESNISVFESIPDAHKSIFLHFVCLVGENRHHRYTALMQRVDQLGNKPSLGCHWIIPTVPYAEEQGLFASIKFARPFKMPTKITNEYSVVRVTPETHSPYICATLLIPTQKLSFLQLITVRQPINTTMVVQDIPTKEECKNPAEVDFFFLSEQVGIQEL